MRDYLGDLAWEVDKKENRLEIWDLYNQPGNSGYGNKSFPFLQKVFARGREVNLSQPLSSAFRSFNLESSPTTLFFSTDGESGIFGT